MSGSFTVLERNEGRIINTLLILYFISITLFPLGSVLLLILLTVFYVFTGKISNSIGIIKEDNVLKIFIGYYLLHAAGLIYSSNIGYGLEDLQIKLSFLIVPIVLTGLNIANDTFEKIKTAFIFGTSLSLLILFSLSMKEYIQTNDSNEFYYSRLSHFRHSTYLSIYFNISLLFLQEKIYKGSKYFPNWLISILFLFLFTGILLLSARTATITAMVTAVLFPVISWDRKQVSTQKWMIHLFFVIAMGVLFLGSLQFKNRYNQVTEEIVYREHLAVSDTTTQESPNSTNIRINLWKNSLELIKQNPLFGVGTGDLKDELFRLYKENNYQYGMLKKPSPHNQFLHTSVILGLTGFLFLCSYLFIPLFQAYKRRYWLYVFFLIIIIANCITESILEREAGILLFVFMNMFFYLQLKSQRIN